MQLIKFLMAIFKKRVIEKPTNQVDKTQDVKLESQSPTVTPEVKKVNKPIRHENSGHCLKCKEILDKFGGTHTTLIEWFNNLQKHNPEAHCNFAGRNKIDQEQAFASGTSKARFGQSAHNFAPALAIDIFQLTPDGKAAWPVDWYKKVVKPNLVPGLVWGGDWISFKDYPHVELLYWKELVNQGKSKLIS